MTNLSKNIVKAKILLETKNIDDIFKRCQLLSTIREEMQRNVDRFTKDDKHNTIFNHEDLQELAELANEVLHILKQRVNVNKMSKEMWKGTEVSEDTIMHFMDEYTTYFYVMRELTCFHNMVSYLAVILDVLEKKYNQGELGFAILEAVSNRIY